MKGLATLFVLVASIASADVMQADNNAKVTVDCKKDPVVDIAGNSNTFTLKGTCTTLRVSGNKNTVTGDVKTIEVSGNDNKVSAGTTGSILVSGDRNTVSWKKGGKKPNVADSGEGNNVAEAK